MPKLPSHLKFENRQRQLSEARAKYEERNRPAAKGEGSCPAKHPWRTWKIGSPPPKSGGST